MYIVPRNPPPVYGGDGAVFVPELTPERFEKAMKNAAAKTLRALETEARAAAVTRVLAHSKIPVLVVR